MKRIDRLERINKNKAFDAVLYEMNKLINNFINEAKTKYDMGVPSNLFNKEKLDQLFNTQIAQFREKSGQITGLGEDVPQVSYFLDEGKLQIFMQGWYYQKAKDMILIGTRNIHDKYYDFYILYIKDVNGVETITLYTIFGNKTGTFDYHMELEQCKKEFDEKQKSTKAMAYMFYLLFREKCAQTPEQVGYVNIGGKFNNGNIDKKTKND